MNEVWTHWVDATRACAILDVKRRTLYSYVSQGRIRSAPAPGSRKRRYAIEDVMHLRDRARARSAFTARVAASAAADPIAVVLAALATHTGARHGGVSRHVGVLLDSTTPERAEGTVRSWIRRGEMASLPGFGHRLYAGGDPRGTFLLEEAESLAPRRKAVRTACALVEAAEAAGYEPPNLDLGLTALGHALGIGPEGGQAIFAIGRMAGWLAHAREQLADGRILRPRARFVGAAETPS